MSRKAVAIIKGGLGNQLFGYAAARAFALRSGRELFIDDASGFVRDGYGRSFRLKHFPIEARPAPAALRLGDPKGFRHKSKRSLNKVLPLKWKAYLPEKEGSLQLLDFDPVRDTVYLNGYWQNEAYFRDATGKIREELQPPALEKQGDLELEQRMRDRNAVFVHVRRNRYSPRLGADYYKRSIELASEALDSPCFEVFGDDIAWARKQLDFGGRTVRFHEEANDELVDFRLMTACKHAIVANSSFSWWAAWLGPSLNGHVWTPKDPGWPVKPASGWTTVGNTLERD
ncbi:alpha-1,2-fucosyltransferase [Haloferula helveola]|uniref:Alpha-1,2-fucosyltransferase n=1 Tax=Haloferula helveola TaxID=490095 RepID=A0ABM7RCV9_9BACT|nr:alpha-1,2-fucosyltransferase [Haloferula helveola]